MNEVTIPQPLIPIEKFIQAVKLEIDTNKEGLETQQEDGSVGIPDLLDSLVDMRQIYDTKTEQEEIGTSHSSVNNVSKGCANFPIRHSFTFIFPSVV